MRTPKQVLQQLLGNPGPDPAPRLMPSEFMVETRHPDPEPPQRQGRPTDTLPSLELLPRLPAKKTVWAMPFCAKDISAAILLLDWIRNMCADALPLKATAVTVSPHFMPDSLFRQVADRMEGLFEDYLPLTLPFDLPDERWPVGPNWSFLKLANCCYLNQWDFFVNEPDCIPLRPDWWHLLKKEWEACGCEFMGYIEPETPSTPRHMAGCGFYHWTAFDHFRADLMGTAWDVAMAPTIVPRAHRTPLIHQEFGPLDQPPRFQFQSDLKRIPLSAAVFHRSKDGGLIKLLRERGL